MKQKSANQAGFTLIELLVVLSIMTLLMGSIILNFNRTRAARSATFAQNETVTNIKKVQSYMLSARNLATDIPAKFYYIKFTKGQKTYTIGGVDNNYGLYANIETVTLPGDVAIGDLSFVPGSPGTTACVEILFSAPFGKMYLNDDPSCNASITTIAQSPTTLYALNGQVLEITLTPTNNAASKTIDVRSLTGRVDAN